MRWYIVRLLGLSPVCDQRRGGDRHKARPLGPPPRRSGWGKGSMESCGKNPFLFSSARYVLGSGLSSFH